VERQSSYNSGGRELDGFKLVSLLLQSWDFSLPLWLMLEVEIFRRYSHGDLEVYPNTRDAALTLRW
jgi:hypothetical protein